MRDYLHEVRAVALGRFGFVPLWLWILDLYALPDVVPGLSLFVSWAAFLGLFVLPAVVVRRRASVVKSALTHGRAHVEGGFDVPSA